MSKIVEFIFNISKSVDMYMEDMPFTAISSADALVEIKTNVAAAVLEAIVSGNICFTIKSSIEHAVTSLLSEADTTLDIGTSALVVETRSVIDKIRSSVLVDSSSIDALVDVMSGTVSSKLKVSACISNAFMITASSANGTATLSAMINEAVLKSEINGTESVIGANTSLTSPPIMSTVIVGTLPCSVQVSSSASETKLLYFRTVAECDKYTVAELGAMTLEEFYLTEL